jgi:hypothetical protein
MTFQHFEQEAERIDDIVQHRLLMRELRWTKTAQDALGRGLSKEEKTEAKRWFNMGRPVEEFLDHVLTRARTG